MTAFLFIPGSADAGVARRIDLADFASLFAEAEEPVDGRGRGHRIARMLAMLMVLSLAIGDTVLIGWPNALTHTVGIPAATSATPVTSL